MFPTNYQNSVNVSPNNETTLSKKNKKNKLKFIGKNIKLKKILKKILRVEN
jgi:hypothetical protein